MATHVTRWSLISAVMFAVIGLSASEGMAQTGKVRVRNETDTDIRAFCVSFDPNIQFAIDVRHSDFETQFNVKKVPRGVSIFENFNNKCIVTDSFEWPSTGENVEIKVSGTKAAGYKIDKTYSSF